MNRLDAVLAGLAVMILLIWASRRFMDKVFPRPKFHKSYGSADAMADKIEKILKKREKKK